MSNQTQLLNLQLRSWIEAPDPVARECGTVEASNETHLRTLTSADGTGAVWACSAGARSSCPHLVATIAVQGVGGAAYHTIPDRDIDYLLSTKLSSAASPVRVRLRVCQARPPAQSQTEHDGEERRRSAERVRPRGTASKPGAVTGTGPLPRCRASAAGLAATAAAATRAGASAGSRGRPFER
jgi:hypothetical protein